MTFFDIKCKIVVKIKSYHLTRGAEGIIMSRAEQSRAEQSRAEQSRAEQSRAEQSRATKVSAFFFLIQKFRHSFWVSFSILSLTRDVFLINLQFIKVKLII